MVIDKEVNLKKAITIYKPKLREYAITRMFEVDLNLVDQITDKVLSKSLIYLQGYTDAIYSDLQLPIQQESMLSLLKEVGFKYIYNSLLKSRK